AGPGHLVSVVWHCAPRDLPSFPTRRSSDLTVELLHAPLCAMVAGLWMLQAGKSCRWSPDGVQGIDGRGRSRVIGSKRVFADRGLDRKSTRLNSSHVKISYAVFCLKKKKTQR